MDRDITFPNAALMGNMASAGLVWLCCWNRHGFDKPVYGLLPMLIIIMDYLGKADKKFQKLPSGLIAIVVGTADRLGAAAF